MKKVIVTAVFLILTIIFVIFSALVFNNNRSNNLVVGSKIKVVTSFYPLYFFTTKIAQEKANVFNITPPGVEPHDFEPAPQNIAQMENSRILILNGGGFEPWAKSVVENIGSGNTDIVTMLNSSASDPHIWLSPKMALKITDKILQEFIKVDPQNSEFYIKNTENLNLDLTNLDNDFKNGLANCKKRDIITTHAAFGYLASDYNLSQVSISGLSPEAEPSIQKIAQVAKFARDNDVKYIFFESLVSPKFADTIALEVGAKTLVLNPIEGLTESEISSGQNYFTKMHDNLTNLRIALNCK